MQRDPDKVVDASKETRVNWDAEVSSGNLVRTSGHAKHNANDPACLHIQGRPVTDEQARSRIVPASVMEYVTKTGRYPSGSSGHSSFGGGWPTFDKDGKVIRQEPPEPHL